MMHDLRTVEGLAAALREAWMEYDHIQINALRSIAPQRDLLLQNWDFHMGRQDKYDIPPENVKIGPFQPGDVEENRTHRLHPVPTHLIKLTMVERGKGTNAYRNEACGLVDGEYRICVLVPRKPPRRKKPPAEPIDLRPTIVLFQERLRPLVEKVGQLFAEKPLQFIRFAVYANANGGGGSQFFLYLAPFEEANWQNTAWTTEGMAPWPEVGALFQQMMAGATEAITLDGQRVDLEQANFDAQFPNWTGFRVFREQLEKALLQALQPLIEEARQKQVPAYRELKALILGEDRERRSAEKIGEFDGIAIYREHPKKRELPPSKGKFRSAIQPDYPAALPEDAAPKPKKVKDPGAVTEAAAIKEIAKLAKVKKGAAIDAKALIEEFIRQYREVRIQGAKDSLMIEWGAATAPLSDQLIDTRGGKEPKVKYSDQKLQWIGLTRQIDLDREDDNTALGLSLYFADAAEKEPSGMFEISGVDELDVTMQKFQATPAIQKLLASPAVRVAVTASGVG